MRSARAWMARSACLGVGCTLALVAVWGGCGDAPPPKPAEESAVDAPLPAGMVLASAPDGALGVAAVKRDAKEGDEVVIRGIVGGSREPFVAGRALFTIVDPGLKTCAATPADHCPTP